MQRDLHGKWPEKTRSALWSTSALGCEDLEFSSWNFQEVIFQIHERVRAVRGRDLGTLLWAIRTHWLQTGFCLAAISVGYCTPPSIRQRRASLHFELSGRMLKHHRHAHQADTKQLTKVFNKAASLQLAKASNQLAFRTILSRNRGNSESSFTDFVTP